MVGVTTHVALEILQTRLLHASDKQVWFKMVGVSIQILFTGSHVLVVQLSDTQLLNKSVATCAQAVPLQVLVKQKSLLQLLLKVVGTSTQAVPLQVLVKQTSFKQLLLSVVLTAIQVPPIGSQVRTKQASVTQLLLRTVETSSLFLKRNELFDQNK